MKVMMLSSPRKIRLLDETSHSHRPDDLQHSATTAVLWGVPSVLV